MDLYFNKIKIKLERKEPQVCKYFAIQEGYLFKREKRDNSEWKLYVPEKCLFDVIVEYHERNGHPGVNRLFAYLSEFTFSNKYKTRIKELVRSCDVCQRVKAPNINNQGICYTEAPKRKLDRVYIDAYGPVPVTRFGYENIIIMLDAFSKFVKFYVVKKVTSKAVIGRIKSYIKEVGFPRMIISDHASVFQSKFYGKSLKELGIKKRNVSLFFPQANAAERYLRELGTQLRCYLYGKKQTEWYKFVQEIEHNINNNYSLVTKYKPIEVMRGIRVKDSLTKIINFPRGSENERFQSENELNAQVVHRLENNARKNYIKSLKKLSKVKYSVGDYVLVRHFPLSKKYKKFSKKLCVKFKGPFEILKVYEKNTLKLKNTQTGKAIRMNRALVKRYFHR